MRGLEYVKEGGLRALVLDVMDRTHYLGDSFLLTILIDDYLYT